MSSPVLVEAADPTRDEAEMKRTWSKFGVLTSL